MISIQMMFIVTANASKGGDEVNDGTEWEANNDDAGVTDTSYSVRRTRMVSTMKNDAGYNKFTKNSLSYVKYRTAHSLIHSFVRWHAMEWSFQGGSGLSCCKNISYI